MADNGGGHADPDDVGSGRWGARWWKSGQTVLLAGLVSETKNAAARASRGWTPCPSSATPSRIRPLARAHRTDHVHPADPDQGRRRRLRRRGDAQQDEQPAGRRQPARRRDRCSEGRALSGPSRHSSRPRAGRDAHRERRGRAGPGGAVGGAVGRADAGEVQSIHKRYIIPNELSSSSAGAEPVLRAATVEFDPRRVGWPCSGRPCGARAMGLPALLADDRLPALARPRRAWARRRQLAAVTRRLRRFCDHLRRDRSWRLCRRSAPTP